MDPIIADTARRIIADHKDQPQAMWSALTDSGLTSGWSQTEDGDAGLSMIDGFGLIRIIASAGVPIPFAETLLAGFILKTAGVDAPAGKGAVLLQGNLPVAAGNFTGNLPAVGFAAELDWLLCLQPNNGGQLVLLPAPASTTATDSLDDDPAASMHYTDCEPLAVVDGPEWLDGMAFQLLAALVRAGQLCGVMESALDLTLAFSAEREQFGRSLSKFQAIQHMLSEMAGETSAAIAAFDSAVEEVNAHGASLLSAASAKARASEAAGIVVAHAHQVHGAIGYTQEYALAKYTRRLLRWRDDFGDETYWSVAVGRAITAADAPTITELVFGKTS